MGDATSTVLLKGNQSLSELPSLFDAKREGSTKGKTPKEKEKARANILSGRSTASSSFGQSISPSGRSADTGGGISAGGAGGGASRGLGIGGAILSSFGEIEKGFAQSKELIEQAQQFELESRQAAIRGSIAATNESIRANRAIGSQIVGSSTSLTGSSAGVVIAEFEGSKTNINIIRLDASQRESLLRDAARRARRSAKLARKSGFLRAGAKIVGSFF